MAGSEIPALEDQLCFDLYVASRAMTQAYRPVLREMDLTYPQYLVLIVLWTERKATVGHLADVLRLDYGTLTPLLRRMEANGVVIRRRASSDERFVEIGLTARGEAMSAHASRIHCDMKTALGLNEEEFAHLQNTLRTLTSRLQEQPDIEMAAPNED